MYQQFEEAGLILDTPEWRKRQEEKEKGSAADQSNAEPVNNTHNAISMFNLA